MEICIISRTVLGLMYQICSEFLKFCHSFCRPLSEWSGSKISEMRKKLSGLGTLLTLDHTIQIGDYKQSLLPFPQRIRWYISLRTNGNIFGQDLVFKRLQVGTSWIQQNEYSKVSCKLS